MTKSLFASKTFWFNVLAAAVMFLQSAELLAMLPPSKVPHVAAVVAVLNILLRYITTQPVTLSGTGDGT